MYGRFTEEELRIAKSTDLVKIAEELGFTPKRIGKYYTLKEMDSIRIYDRSHWFRWSRQYEKGNNGGSQIDFLRVFAGKDVKEAVFWLLEFAGYYRRQEGEMKIILQNQIPKKTKKQPEKKVFRLPFPSHNNFHLYSYLQNVRGIRKEVIDYFVGQQLIYESRKYHNIVFKGKDKNGRTRFASMRGVFDYKGKPFKCDVEGNDKRYGFNVVNQDNEELYVFEGAIDLISHTDIWDDFESNKLALGMLSDAPLVTFLEENPQITGITFCLDNDGPGRKATEILMEKYYGLGYEVKDCPPPNDCKDYNEWLVRYRGKCDDCGIKNGESVMKKSSQTAKLVMKK